MTCGQACEEIFLVGKTHLKYGWYWMFTLKALDWPTEESEPISMHPRIHYSVLLAVDVMLPARWGSCRLDLSVTVERKLELRAQETPSLLNCLYLGICHSNGKQMSHFLILLRFTQQGVFLPWLYVVTLTILFHSEAIWCYIIMK